MAQLFFSKFDVTRQVFFRSRLSYGVVNLKPIVPGHVLVVPQRVVSRLSDLTQEEVADLFVSAQKIGGVIEKAYQAHALTVACQDGAAAGQSVPHVHVHVMPRKWEDFDGENDQVYPALEANEEVLAHGPASTSTLTPGRRRRQEIKVDADEARMPRTMEEMEEEATRLKGLFMVE